MRTVRIVRRITVSQVLKAIVIAVFGFWGLVYLDVKQKFGEVDAMEIGSLEVEIEIPKEEEKEVREIGEYTLREYYEMLAGEYLTGDIEPHLEIIDKVLVERGYRKDKEFVRRMFYTGHQESHWNMGSKGGFEHLEVWYDTMGAFQFVPGTFYSVNPEGNIDSLKDQLHAFITMVEHDRLKEFEVTFTCNYEPCL